eukprot:m51a1_g3967 hypothetical protein (794) ;mRNA; f:388273-391198
MPQAHVPSAGLLLLSALLLVPALSCDAQCQWSNFKRDYNKVYATPQEEARRFAIFTQRLAEIDRFNIELAPAEFGVNEFADLSVQEFAEQYLTSDVHGFINTSNVEEPPLPRVAVRDIPETYDVKYITPVRKQGNKCGACWAFTTMAVIESEYWKATGSQVILSPQQLVDCQLGGTCTGGWADSALSALIDLGTQNGGIITEDDHPYTAQEGKCPAQTKGVVQVKSMWNVEWDEATMDQKIYTLGAMAVTMDATPLVPYKKGVFPDSMLCRRGINHAVTLVGYGTEADSGKRYWKIKNSWGAGWGEQGFLRLERGTGACLITTYPAAGAVLKDAGSDDASLVCQPTRKCSDENRVCGTFDPGCGSVISCGTCAVGSVCRSDGSCKQTSIWVENPKPQDANFLVKKNTTVSISTVGTLSSPKIMRWDGSETMTNATWTSFTSQITAKSSGVVGLGMRMGQTRRPLDGIFWSVDLPASGSGRVDLNLTVRWYGDDNTFPAGSANWPSSQSAPVNFTVEFSTSDEYIITKPYINGVAVLGPGFFLVPLRNFPVIGSAFIVASGSDKVFDSPKLITRTILSVQLSGCVRPSEFASQVARVLGVKQSVVNDLNGTDACSSGGSADEKAYRGFSFALPDANETYGLAQDIEVGVQSISQTQMSTDLAARLQVASQAGGSLDKAGLHVAAIALIAPIAVAGTALPFALAVPAETAGLSTGAIVGIAVGASVGAAVAVAATGAAVYVATRPEPEKPIPEDYMPGNPLRKTFYKVQASRGVDIYAPKKGTSSITNRAPPVQL